MDEIQNAEIEVQPEAEAVTSEAIPTPSADVEPDEATSEEDAA